MQERLMINFRTIMVYTKMDASYSQISTIMSIIIIGEECMLKGTSTPKLNKKDMTANWFGGFYSGNALRINSGDIRGFMSSCLKNLADKCLLKYLV
mmetsp:Transcript_32475/g.79088  ORF Transcript_32475/g.79088 Transcript_32475/m.79088 type:complete len:96 (-) Transcript_32475:40-327(-)